MLSVLSITRVLRLQEQTHGRWPTPQARDWKGESGRSLKGQERDLPSVTQMGVVGSLNPDWVDALMGYPVGYTLPDSEPMRWLPDTFPTSSPDGAWGTPNASDALNFGNTGAAHLQRDIDRGLLRGQVTKWPAGLGAPQHDWEPPRLTTVKEHRAARLKALGNSIVPEVARLWFEAIALADGDAVCV